MELEDDMSAWQVGVEGRAHTPSTAQTHLGGKRGIHAAADGKLFDENLLNQ